MHNYGRKKTKCYSKNFYSFFNRQLSSMHSLETLHLSNTKRTLSNVPAILEQLPNLSGKNLLLLLNFELVLI